MGTADTPAEPIKGFTLPPVTLHMILPKMTPPAVANENASSPNTIIFRVSSRRKESAVMDEPTASARKMVTVFIK
jgi:hypothetical protein